MNEIYVPPSADNSEDKKKHCLKFEKEENNLYDGTVEKHRGTMCFDTEEKMDLLFQFLSSDDEKECLNYQVEAQNLISRNLDKKNVKMCVRKENNN